MVVCGFNNAPENVVAGKTDAQRVAWMVSVDSFDSYYGKRAEDVRSDVKSFWTMQVAQWRIHWTSNNQEMITTFICWVQEKYRTSIQPEDITFLSDVVAREIKTSHCHVKEYKANNTAAVELTILKNYDPEEEWPN